MTADEAGLEIASSMESAGSGAVQVNQQAAPAEKGAHLYLCVCTYILIIFFDFFHSSYYLIN